MVGSLRKELLPLPVVEPLPVHQLLVGSPLLNSPLAEEHDLICPLDGLQPVGDDQEGLLRAAGQGLLNLSVTPETLIQQLWSRRRCVIWLETHRIFAVGVQSAGDFIQDEDLRPADQGACDGDALPLALGQQAVGLPQL